MRLLIPEIGTLLTLTADWYFDLYNEYRNQSLIDQLSLKTDPSLNGFILTKSSSCRKKDYWKAKIGKGSTLKVARIYIRKGSGDYSSITFNLHGGEGVQMQKPKLKPRFWAKLDQVNNIIIRDDR